MKSLLCLLRGAVRHVWSRLAGVPVRDAREYWTARDDSVWEGYWGLRDDPRNEYLLAMFKERQ